MGHCVELMRMKVKGIQYAAINEECKSNSVCVPLYRCRRPVFPKLHAVTLIANVDVGRRQHGMSSVITHGDENACH